MACFELDTDTGALCYGTWTCGSNDTCTTTRRKNYRTVSTRCFSNQIGFYCNYSYTEWGVCCA